jgi:Bax protein
MENLSEKGRKMFLTLNRTIKWLIIFLIIEILFLSISSLFEKKETTSLHHYQFGLQSAPSKPKILVHSTFYSIIKERSNPFRMITLKSEDDVLSMLNKKVEPICYMNTIPLETLSIRKKKETFINMMIPSILLAKHKMKMERKKVFRLSHSKYLSFEDDLWLKEKKEQFRVSDNQELYKSMTLHPTSLIIAQSIIESGWGTSKFFKNANNVFGIWSFSKKDKRLIASEKRGKSAVYLKKYSSIHESIYDYLLIIANVSHYKKFREKRLQTQDPFTLLNYLDKYSERGKEYLSDIKNIIKSNQLTQYDSYELNL